MTPSTGLILIASIIGVAAILYAAFRIAVFLIGHNSDEPQ